ncbi:oxidoreductase, partial [Streptomyces sp. NTH33]
KGRAAERAERTGPEEAGPEKNGPEKAGPEKDGGFTVVPFEEQLAALRG